MEKAELLEQLKALLAGDVSEIKDQVDEIKSRFYRITREEKAGNDEVEISKAQSDEGENIAAVENASERSDLKKEEADENASERLVVENASERSDEIESQFKQLLQEYKSRRAELAAKKEAEAQENLLKKENILDRMKALAENETADVSENLQQFRLLQAEWKAIGPVPPQNTASLQKRYAAYGEQFYDLLKINIELREYDFKKNLVEKNALIAAAEELQNKADIVEANRQLQKLHEQWAEIGPVAKEIREEVWQRFKDASSVINKKHQEYFTALHAKEQENLEKKEMIIAQLRDMDIDSLSSHKDWEEATKKVLELQAEWRKIGFAPKKNNQIIYDEYRSYTDRFFLAKTAHYKDARNVFAENLKQKRALIEEAEALKDSTEWKETTKKFIDLQNRWKEIGPVTRKHSDEVWKQFTQACDYFFAHKKEALQQTRDSYMQRKAQKEGKGGALTDDRRKLLKMYESLEAETKTMENNMGFFTGKASALLDSMKKKIEANKQKMADIEAKINALDDETD